MAKKVTGVAISIPQYKEPSKADIVKSEARYLGERIANADPKVKKLKNEIIAAVEKAVKKAVK